MTPTVQLWLCIGIVYMFAISDRSYMEGHLRDIGDFIGGVLTEVTWAFVLVAPAATYAVLALRDIFKG